jgi:hypothetical protein
MGADSDAWSGELREGPGLVARDQRGAGIGLDHDEAPVIFIVSHQGFMVGLTGFEPATP